jgi:hypothetical protein
MIYFVLINFLLESPLSTESPAPKNANAGSRRVSEASKIQVNRFCFEDLFIMKNRVIIVLNIP